MIYDPKANLKIFVIILATALTLSCSLFTFDGTLAPDDRTAPDNFDTVLPPQTSIPPVSLNPTSPYVVFAADSGIWITNPDGSFPTQLTTLDPELVDLSRLISPGGDRLAMVARNETGFDLIEVGIPSGEVKTLAHLLDITETDLSNDATSPKAIASYAIMRYDSLAWQPGSTGLLAFIGAMHGPSADLYTIDTASGEISHLTDGPSQAIYPNWSPDGEYLLHYGVSWVPPFGGAILGYNRLDGVSAIRIADGELIDQPEPAGEMANFIGWQDDSHYLIFDSNFESAEGCIASNVRSVDITNAQADSFLDMSFYSNISFSPENGALLFSGSASCPDSPGEGVFLLKPGQTSPEKLHAKKAIEIGWLPESALFQAYPEALFSADGSLSYEPPIYDKSFHPSVSKQGYQAWEVIENQVGRVELRGPNGDWQTVMEGSVAQLIWDPMAGNTLLIALQDGSLYSASYPDFAPHLQGNLGGHVNQSVWIP